MIFILTPRGSEVTMADWPGESWDHSRTVIAQVVPGVVNAGDWVRMWLTPTRGPLTRVRLVPHSQGAGETDATPGTTPRTR